MKLSPIIEISQMQCAVRILEFDYTKQYIVEAVTTLQQQYTKDLP